MIIGIDGNEANVHELVGVSVYTLELLRYFASHADSQVRFIVFLKQKPMHHLPIESKHFSYEIVPDAPLWSQTLLPLKLMQLKFSKNRLSVFFSPAHYSPRFCPCPSIVTIHDLSYFYYPDEFLKKDFYQLKNWTEYSVKKAKKVICVSETTKKDLIKFYQVSENKITVIYNGYEKNPKLETRNSGQIRNPQSVIRNPYILYVGTLQPRKNIQTLIKAFGKFKLKNPNFKLIIAGKKGWLYERIFAEVQKLRLENDILFLGYVTNEELNNLYQNAFCFVLPSLYEGFGIPVLEAMAYNCPVISSFASSLPEIGADACLYFDPKDQSDLFDKLKMLQQNKTLRSELIKKGKERIKQFSWMKCGEETLEILTK